MDLKNKKIVGILRGGSEDSYLQSLKEGGEILSFLAENLSDAYKPVDILIDREGVWYMGGVPIEPASLMQKIDLAWNTAHPSFSQILRSLAIPTIDEPAHFRAIKQSREMLRNHIKQIGINLPRHILIPAYQPDIDGPVVDFAYRKAQEVFQKFGAPWVVKSFPQNQDMGVHVAQTFDALVRGILDGVLHYSSVEIEEMISDRVAEIHTVTGFRNQEVYKLPLERLSKEEKEKINELADKMHKHFGAEYYLNAKVSIHPKRGIFLSDVSLVPKLGKDSDLHRAGELIGLETKHIMSHILERVR